VGLAQGENLFFQPADRAGFQVGDDHEMRGVRIRFWLAAAETVGRRGGGRFGRRRSQFGFSCLEQRRQLGVFDGGMELFFAGAGDQRMIRQAVFSMKTLHLFESVGAIHAAADADCPGFRHDTLR
jgi:hypothetical protein